MDLVFDPPAHRLAALRSSPGLTTLTALDNRVLFIGMDQTRQELLYSNVPHANPLASPLVRKALYAAIDIQKIKKDVMNEQMEPRGTIVAPLTTGWSKTLDVRPNFSIQLAKKWLSQAGYPSGFSTRLLCPNNRYINDEQVCEALARMWRTIGVNVKVDSKPISEVIANIHAKNFSMYFLGWAAPTFDAHYTLNSLVRSPHSPEQTGLNSVGYHNPELDITIDRIATEINIPKRNALIARALATVKEDTAVIPLYNQIAHWVHNRKINLHRRSDMRPDWTSIEIKGSS
jgi:peptide/nickel transport system substrate-binding protein